MSTAQIAMDESAAIPTPPERTYLNASYGIKSWLLTEDHKRIALWWVGCWRSFCGWSCRQRQLTSMTRLARCGRLGFGIVKRNLTSCPSLIRWRNCSHWRFPSSSSTLSGSPHH
jgi:hypothetical protein